MIFDIPSIKYPVGVQAFSKMREVGYLYVDKTPWVWRLANDGSNVVFLSRPRRFGKSLMLSTLDAYFSGQKELFEGLYISTVEKEWIEYPVFHFDFNLGLFKSVPDLVDVIDYYLRQFEEKYGLKYHREDDVSVCFSNLITEVYNRTGQKVVILVDEYDKPILNNVENKELTKEIRDTLKSFYGVLKTCDPYIRFAMFTGVARFAKVSIFSDLNNLKDISLEPEYNAICGISESELNNYFSQSIEDLAKALSISNQEAREKLKTNYDGYRFTKSPTAEGIYNPFSLMNCFTSNSISNYWLETGTPTFLVKLMMKDGYDFSDSEIGASEDELKGVNQMDFSPISLMYQTGYYTIKKYDPEFHRYILGYPNREVEVGFKTLTYNAYTLSRPLEFNIENFLRDLETAHTDDFMRRLQSLLAKIPYEQAREVEAVYHNALYLLFTMLGYRTECECSMNQGRTDMVVFTKRYIYVFEFKLNRSAAEAMAQINSRLYDSPYQSDGRRIIKVGVNFASDRRNIESWVVENAVPYEEL